jgi:hypothetical protein
MIIHSIASAQPRVATLHLIVHELVVFLVVQLCAAKALGPQKSMIFGLIVKGGRGSRASKALVVFPGPGSRKPACLGANVALRRQHRTRR